MGNELGSQSANVLQEAQVKGSSIIFWKPGKQASYHQNIQLELALVLTCCAQSCVIFCVKIYHICHDLCTMQVPIFSIPDCQKAYKGHTNIKTSMLCAGGIGKGTSWVSFLLVGPS